VELLGQIAAVDRQFAAANRVSPAATLVAHRDRLHVEWRLLSPAMQAQVANEVAVFTVNPTARGQRQFDPDSVIVVRPDDDL
jgi:hypothetical protein